MAPAVCWVSADWPITSGDDVALSNGSAILVAGGCVLVFRVFIGDEEAAASRLLVRPEHACCRPLCRQWPQARRGDRAGHGAIRQHTTMLRNEGRRASLSAETACGGTAGPASAVTPAVVTHRGAASDSHVSRRDKRQQRAEDGRMCRCCAGGCCVRFVYTGGGRALWIYSGVLHVKWQCGKLSPAMRLYGRCRTHRGQAGDVCAGRGHAGGVLGGLGRAGGTCAHRDRTGGACGCHTPTRGARTRS